jgi:hypothetical protein
MHEGFHCLCGLLSAGSVLYNNFPNKKVPQGTPSSSFLSIQERKDLFRKKNFASSNWYSPL